MFLVAPPFFRVATGFVAPAGSLTTKSFYSGFYVGYVAPGGAASAQLGDSGGTLSGQLVTGFANDALLQIGDSGDPESDWVVFLYIAGNAVSALAGMTGLKINSTICPQPEAPVYDGEQNVTFAVFAGSAIHLAASTSYTVQLV